MSSMYLRHKYGNATLKWHFRNENKDIHRDMFKLKSKFNTRNKDAAIELETNSTI